MTDIALPIYNGEAISSLFGAMVFPNDREKAEILATALLTRYVARAPTELVELIPAPEIQSLFGRAGQQVAIADEVEKAAYAGTQVGALVSYMWHSQRSGSHASWNDACASAELLAPVGSGLAGVRSSLLQAKSDFSSVLHFWGILSIEYNNSRPRDVNLFIAQSAALLREMRRLEASGVIRGRSLSSPKLYVPIAALNWPCSGLIRAGRISDRYAPRRKKRAGRPKKIPVQK